MFTQNRGRFWYFTSTKSIPITWLNLYDFGTPSYELIETIRDTYYLVAIIDNDYIASSSSGGTGGADDGAGNGLWEALLKVGGVGVEQEQ